jgi:putative transposase
VQRKRRHSAEFKAKVIAIASPPGAAARTWNGPRSKWVDWFNNRRLLEPIGYVTPAEAEATYYSQISENAKAA